MFRKFWKPRNPMYPRANEWWQENKDGLTGSVELIKSNFSENGALAKVFILGVLSLITLFIGYQFPVRPFMVGSGLIGAIVYAIAGYNPRLSVFMAPLYALIKGFFLGSVAAHFESRFDGILLQAFILSIGCIVMMMTVYFTGLIRVTNKFRSIVSSAVGAIMFVYLINIVLRIFFDIRMPFLHEASITGIAINTVILVFASLNLLLNFDYFEKAVKRKYPDFMEWYFAMAFLFTIIWIYIEFLRLLSKVRRFSNAGGSV